MADVDRFKGTLPYASELFGIYQPLLGWKSKLTAERYERQLAPAYDAVGSRFLKALSAPVEVAVRDSARGVEGRGRLTFDVHDLAPLALPEQPGPRVASAVQSGIAQLLLERI